MVLSEDKKIALALTSAQAELQKFFDIKVDLPQVHLVKSRRDFDRLIGYKTESWVVAQVIDKVIYIFNPQEFKEKYNQGDPDRFWKVLKHEYVHLYYRAITGSTQPRWLHEGLACYLANQIKKNPFQESLLIVNDFYDSGGKDVYAIGYFWVKYLLENYSKSKLLELIKTIHPNTTKSQFSNNFKDIYGFGLNKASLNKILNLLNGE